MDGRSIRTRRQWLAACGTAVGATTLAGCTGSDDETADDSDGSAPNGANDGDPSTENDSHTTVSNARWPMSRFTAGNRMVTDDWSGPDGPLEEGWTFETDDGVAVSGPVVDNGLVYVAAEDSVLYALDAVTGDVEWEIDRTYPDAPPGADYPPTTPAISDDTIYFLTDELEAIDPDDGDRRWSVDLGSRSREASDMRVYDGVVYVHTDGDLYAIDTETREIVWEGNADSTEDIAIGADGMFYVVRRTNNDHDYEVLGIDISSAGTDWTYSPPGNVSSGFGLMVRDGTVYLHEMEKLLAIDGHTGDAEVRTEFEQTNTLVPTRGRAPTIADGIAYSAAPSRYPAVHAVELDTGNEPETWDSSALETGPTGLRPFVSADTLYVWRGIGYVDINALDPKSGESRWSFDVRDHQDMVRGTVQGYTILEDKIIYSIDGNYGVVGMVM
ncbi:outer membrane protein assembly factor BamB family protein [Natronolimnohabitans innermongolicus]|uniref:Pyrrolo-quinoline quinone n=1 Tax=Natronolimnohabitans innermongolicus JCM 12255 TaxID=1227499 RepID=L9XIW2_9EURY|nr:PQQ-binding-like beta-propeller repeat protein [Natronolimnohabitans innermongolicus]ELY61655.1 pyrrolo-quinoline quinone [Natronolimnohabitans innermongolicus JCM 12255]